MFKYRTIIKLFTLAVLFVANGNQSFSQKVQGDIGINKYSPEVVQSNFVSKPMQADIRRGMEYKRKQKTVLAERLIDDMENPQTWENIGVGKVSFVSELKHSGQQSLKMTSPTIMPLPEGWEIGRPFQYASVQRKLRMENWNDYNRVSFWVYPDLPGFRVISLEMTLVNDTVPSPISETHAREHINYQLVENNQWNHVIWELTDLPRNKVSAFRFTYRLQGNEPGATKNVTFYFDDLKIEKVEEDHYQGWNVAPKTISYSHTGYNIASEKTALSANVGAVEFSILNANDNSVVLTKPVSSQKNKLGDFKLLNFSEVNQPGLYRIKLGDIVTPPFQINNHVWDDAIWKETNFFFCERCGFELPGIHSVCHRDWQSAHGDKRIVINGGWHDAGDLSQGTDNTAEAVSAFFSLAGKYKKRDTILAARLVEEGKWGLDWLLKTRFGDGYRTTWSTMDFWSDGILDEMPVVKPSSRRQEQEVRKEIAPSDIKDDVVNLAQNSSISNLMAVHAEASAARVLAGIDDQQSYFALNAAVDDYKFALEKVKGSSTIEMSALVLGAVELYKTTGEKKYADTAFVYAKKIVYNQEKNIIPAAIPLTGYFYTNGLKTEILHFFHWTKENLVLTSLVELCKSFPNHPQWMEWYTAVVLHSEYLNAASKYTEPYRMIPAGVYNIDEKTEQNYKDQVKQGVQLTKNLYLRNFPVWETHRGNSGVLLSMTKNLSQAAQLRNSSSLLNLCQKQMEWVVGRNPFSQSLIYGEGYNYQPNFSAFIGDAVGSMPIGIFTHRESDIPYWTPTNVWNQKEVWVHVSARWLQVARDINGPSEITGTTTALVSEIEFVNLQTGASQKVATLAGKFAITLTPGSYKVIYDGFERTCDFLPAANYTLNLTRKYNFSIEAQTKGNGKVVLKLSATGNGKVTFKILSTNLKLPQPAITLNLTPGKEEKVDVAGSLISKGQPWVIVVVPDEDMGAKKDLFGM